MLVTYFNSNKAERALIDKALIFAKEQLLPKVRKLEIDVIMKNNMKAWIHRCRDSWDVGLPVVCRGHSQS